MTRAEDFESSVPLYGQENKHSFGFAVALKERDKEKSESLHNALTNSDASGESNAYYLQTLDPG